MLIIQIALGILFFFFIVAILDRIIHGKYIEEPPLKSYREKD